MRSNLNSNLKKFNKFHKTIHTRILTKNIILKKVELDK